MRLFLFIFSSYNKIQNYHCILFLSLMMVILCTTFGITWNIKSNQDFMLQIQVLHSFILFFLLLSISYHNGKIITEGIAYIGPITMRWYLNDNGPSFHNTFMLRWNTYYKIEMWITQVFAIPISFLLPIIFKSWKSWKM